MTRVQSGILEPLPAAARYLYFTLRPDCSADRLAAAIGTLPQQGDLVIGLGQSLIQHLGANLPELHPFPALTHQGIDIPSTPAALWLWLRGDDRGELLHRSRDIEMQLAEVLELEQVTDAFLHLGGKDLTGYEDGTENPEDEDAVQTAVIHQPQHLQGSSFVAVQQWLHDLDAFDAMSPSEQDDSIGRRKSDNVELDEAPPSAHVKRTAQEDFDPEAFLLRRSMPWVNETGAGLIFASFSHSLAPFEAQLRRMVGLDDGIKDALFNFTRPMTGSYFWCPPVKGKALDLSGLGL